MKTVLIKTGIADSLCELLGYFLDIGT